MRSWLIQSGMKIVTECPRARPSAAKAMPVLPLVASAMGAPARSWPLSVAVRRMCRAIRSLMLPVKLKFSALAKMRRGAPRKVNSIAKSGVLPTSRASSRKRFCVSTTMESPVRDIMQRLGAYLPFVCIFCLPPRLVGPGFGTDTGGLESQ